MARNYNTWEYSYSSFSIGDAVTFNDSTTGHKFSVNAGSFKYTPQVASDVSSSNTNSWCGLTGWEINTPVSVQGKTCGSETQFATGKVVYGDYLLDGNNLYWTFDPDNYPTVNSDYRTFTKQ